MQRIKPREALIISHHICKKCPTNCICKTIDLKTSRISFWTSHTYNDRYIIALNNYGHISGIWQFEKKARKIRSMGTWVDSKYRKYGLAKYLWEYGIQAEYPTKIDVGVISKEGKSLVQAVQKRFPKVQFNLEINY